MNTFISVIVPAYNAEKTVFACAKSILAQRWNRFELIIVDDGSVDGTSVICDEIALSDTRVKVIHRPNGGVGAARNSGLKMASGEFVAFVDSDDEVMVNYLRNLISHISDRTDLVISNASFSNFGKWDTEKYKPLVVKSSNFDDLFAENTLYTAPWSKLYRKSIIDSTGISFPENMSIGEDTVFLLTYMAVSREIVVTNDADYLYYCQRGQLSKKFYRYEIELEISQKIDDVIDNLVSCKNIHTDKAVRRLNDIRSRHYERVLNSLYNYENYSYGRRMRIIRLIDISKMRVFGLKSYGFKAWTLSHLLHFGMIHTYDFVRYGDVCLQNWYRKVKIRLS